MDKHKSNVVESKSSDCNLSKLYQNSTSRSNAGLPTYTTKKSSLYVTKKTSELSSPLEKGKATAQKEQLKAPRRPHRGQKLFLASVLKLLSRNSTGTQYPNNSNQDVTTMNNKDKKNNTTNITQEEPMNEKVKKKKKFRSKVLNSYHYGDDKFEVLQTKKNIDITSSAELSDSVMEEEDFDKIKWSDFLPRLVKPDEEENQLEKEKKLSHLVREVTEGRMILDKNDDSEKEEPVTLVSEKEKDAGFYNFFVDLLETTFSVYNVENKYDACPNLDNQSVSSSKVTFEIDEDVAKKLNVAPKCCRKPSKVCCFKDRCYYAIPDDKKPSHFQLTEPSPYSSNTQESPAAKKKRNRSEFTQLKTATPYSESGAKTQNKSLRKNQNKQNLLKLLKEQLAEERPCEEPQNLYQALKVMAKNKRKSQKTTRFDKSAVDKEFDDRYMCKKRKAITPLPKSRSNYIGRYMRDSQSMPQSSNFSSRRKNPIVVPESEDPSEHSLEVFNVYYDDQGRRVRRRSSRLNLSQSSQPQGYYKDPYDMLKQALLSVETICPDRRSDFANQT